MGEENRRIAQFRAADVLGLMLMVLMLMLMMMMAGDDDDGADDGYGS